MNRSSNPRRRAEEIRRERARAQGRSVPDDNGVMLRFVVCGVIFILLVAAKLLFPDTVSRFTQSAEQFIGRNADFKEAFAAMGRAISGEEPVGDSLQDAYTAVFNPAALETEPDVIQTDEPLSRQNEAAPSSPALSQTNLTVMAPGFGLARQSLPKLPDAGWNAMTEIVVDLDSTVTEQTPDSEETAQPEDDTATSEALSYVYTMPAPPDNASLEQRNLGFDHCTPVHGTLTSTFGWREHPIEGGNKFHYGVDLAAAEGEAILAFADGSVYATGESSTLGNYIMLQHEGGYITLYAHCSKVTVSSGSVEMGEKIAEVGSTGLATGPHLHFELHDGDLYLNPIFYVDVG